MLCEDETQCKPFACDFLGSPPRCSRQLYERTLLAGHVAVLFVALVKLVIAATGASGAIYLQRLLAQIDCATHEVHLVMSSYAREVTKQELDDFKIPAEVSQHSEGDMNVPFVSGSARFDAMVIVPCSMATLGRIASGCSDSVLLRAADVFLKERRKLILVPRETPWNLIHARNVLTLLEAGAIVLPAIPSFYSRPNSITAIVDTVVWRVLDQIGLPSSRAYRWGEESAPVKTSRKKS
jgi:flavin prenyltransferase